MRAAESCDIVSSRVLRFKEVEAEKTAGSDLVSYDHIT